MIARSVAWRTGPWADPIDLAGCCPSVEPTYAALGLPGLGRVWASAAAVPAMSPQPGPHAEARKDARRAALRARLCAVRELLDLPWRGGGGGKARPCYTPFSLFHRDPALLTHPCRWGGELRACLLSIGARSGRSPRLTACLRHDLPPNRAQTMLNGDVRKADEFSSKRRRSPSSRCMSGPGAGGVSIVLALTVSWRGFSHAHPPPDKCLTGLTLQFRTAACGQLYDAPGCMASRKVLPWRASEIG